MTDYEKYCELRNARRETDASVARGTGMPKSTFSEWKKGSYSPKIDKLTKIANYLGVSVSYFLAVENSEQPEEYYLDEETKAMAKELFENKDLRLLFHAARGNNADGLKLAADLLTKLKGTNIDG